MRLSFIRVFNLSLLCESHTDLDDDQYLEQGHGLGVRLLQAPREPSPGVLVSLLQAGHQTPARGVQPRVQLLLLLLMLLLVLQPLGHTYREHHLVT